MVSLCIAQCIRQWQIFNAFHHSVLGFESWVYDFLLLSQEGLSGFVDCICCVCAKHLQPMSHILGLVFARDLLFTL